MPEAGTASVFGGFKLTTRCRVALQEQAARLRGVALSKDAELAAAEAFYAEEAAMLREQLAAAEAAAQV